MHLSLSLSLSVVHGERQFIILWWNNFGRISLRRYVSTVDRRNKIWKIVGFAMCALFPHREWNMPSTHSVTESDLRDSIGEIIGYARAWITSRNNSSLMRERKLRCTCTIAIYKPQQKQQTRINVYRSQDGQAPFRTCDLESGYDDVIRNYISYENLITRERERRINNVML